MKELEITKGEWHKMSAEQFAVPYIITDGDETLMHIYSTVNNEEKKNADFVLDAQHTSLKCNMLPSELLERYNEAIEVLEWAINQDDFGSISGRAQFVRKAKQTISKAKL